MKLTFTALTLAIVANSMATAEDTWKGSAELGYTQSSGNSENSNFVARLDGERNFGKWLYNGHIDAINSSSDDTTTAEKYFLSNRLGYKYTEHNYIFGYQSYENDRFSGYDYQATIAAGYGRRLIDGPPAVLDIEIGPGYRWAELENGDEENEAIVRLFGRYIHNISETSQFEQTVNVESGSDATITRAVSSLKLKVSNNIAVRLSYTLDYNDNVPQGTKHADTETAVTAVYEF